MPKRMWSAFASAALVACSSDPSNPPVLPTDSTVADTTDTSTEDSTPVDGDTAEAPVCTLSGACFDLFLPEQKKATACFGHFGTKCGTFDSTKTKCRWDDGAGFDVVTEDGGGSSVVYKSASGAECFRRTSTGELVFPGSSGESFTSAIKTAPDPANNTLTIGCKGFPGTVGPPFSCKLQECIDCGIDVRTCCL